MAMLYQDDPNLERRRQLAQAMMQQGQQRGPVQHWTQGLDRIANSLIGSYQNKQADKESRQNRQAFQQDLGTALESGDMGALAEVLAPVDSGMATSIKMQLAQQKREQEQHERRRQQSLQDKKDLHDYKSTAGGEIGKYNPRDYTVDSWSQFAENRDPRVLKRYEPYKNVKIGGVDHVFDPSRGGYFPASVDGSSPGSVPATPAQPKVVTPEDVGRNEATIAAAKKTAEIDATDSAEARADFGRIQKNAQDMMGVLDQLIKHPGREIATGGSSMFMMDQIPGTEGRSFNALLDQVKGKTFLEAYQSLKGGGQITEVEGTKAEQSIARLDKGQKEEDFVQAAEDLKAVVQNGLIRAAVKAGEISP